MSTVRRWYIYIVSAISLQAVAWAVIALLRNLFVFGIDPEAVAFRIAVIVIGLPFFLAHWLWGRKLASQDVDERGAALRRFYLYGSMAAFLGPFAANAFDLLRRLLGGTSIYQDYDYRQLSAGESIVYHLAALIILAGLWFYHRQVAAEDSEIARETGGSASVRRFYLLGFSATGLTMVTLAVIHLIRWIMLQFGGVPRLGTGLNVAPANEIARLIVGVPLWVIFWRREQRLFYEEGEEERNSALRKFYLYGAVFTGALGVVANGTAVLAGLFRRLLALTPSGSGDISQPLPVIIGMGMLWGYHALVLRDDAKQAGEASRQAGVRRFYHYLIAAIGLSALLVGASGDISVSLRALGAIFSSGLRGQFAWFTAAIVAGLPVWFIPWRRVQHGAAETGPGGAEERRSVVRKIYLYFFLFLATITALSSAVYIVFRILSTVLGERSPTLAELGQAISFGLIAIVVWLYHGSALRGDGNLARRERASLLEALRVVVVDLGDGRFGNAVVDHLRRDIPSLSVSPIVVPWETNGKAGANEDGESATGKLAGAGLIIGPWDIVVPGGAGGKVSADVAQAVLTSPARKLLVPFSSEGLDWAGVDRWDSEGIVHQTSRAVKQVLAGEEIKTHRSMGAGAIIAIILGVMILLLFLAIPLLYYFLW